MRLIRLRKRRGMTLVEAGIAMTIISIISVALLMILSQSIVGWHRGTAENKVTNAATFAAQKLAAEIRDGKSAVVSGGVLKVTFPLKITDPVSGEKMYDISGSDPVTRQYYILNGNLVRRLGDTGTPEIIQRDVTIKTDSSGILMLGAENGEVNVVFQSTETIGATRQTDQLQHPRQEVDMRITLRNYRPG